IDGDDLAGTYRNILVGSDGRIWTNNWSGGVYRSRAAVFPPRGRPQLLITSLSIAEGVRTRGYLTTNPSLELREHQNTLEITFALTNPLHPERVSYAYKLDGFDKDWVAAGQRRFVRYANLKGGRYRLHVRATDFDGTERASELLAFSIAIPFYKSAWFIALSSAVLLTFLLMLYRQHIQNIRAQEKLKSEFDLKLSNLEMQALRSQMSPHFIFNSLNSIKYYVINKEADEAADYLTKFSQLIRVILENSKSELLTLRQEIRALQLYCEIENLRFDERFTFRFEVDPEINLDQFKIPPMLIQPHIENAIWHGLMHKDGERSLSVMFAREERGIQCTIADNGIGRARAQELANSRRHKKQSLGTSITSDRIEMINKLYGTHVRSTTEDLFATDGSPAGTRVSIYIDDITQTQDHGQSHDDR
ncbi:MAG: histidine kinase, partial [Saprospiraceae bacterium]|nr:histidine kinase [Saprospiraceae bacterium]